ncbi:MCM2/3/5 family domain-containing protein [Ditylenchus destructor]|nr:MCM2/3/5 family domain-containing protein [Ditylenchus destructor]
MNQSSSNSGGGRGGRRRAMMESDSESVVSGSVAENQASQDQHESAQEGIAELFGDERDQYNEEEDDDGEDLFGDNMEMDYRAQPELDELSESGLDDASEFSELSIGARHAADRAMAERDNMAVDDDHLFYEEGDDISVDMRRRKRRTPTEEQSYTGEDPDEDIPIDILENTRDRSPRDHVSDEAVGREIERRFRNFLRTFKDPVTKQIKYIMAIKQLAADNRESLEVDYADLSDDKGDQQIVYFLPEAPIQVLNRLDNGATTVIFAMYPWYNRITSKITVRIKNFVIEEDIRMLRQLHLNMFVKTTGVVTITTGILPQLSIIKYDCKTCSYVLGPFVQRQDEEVKPSSCPSCQSRGPFELNVEQTIYHNYQRITIQESPNLVAAGRLPRSKDVILLGDLCDTCKPGDEIELTGTYTNSYDGSLNSKQGFPVFNTMFLANHIGKKDRIESDSLTDDDIKAIQSLAKDPQIAQRIYCSIAPTIYGHEDVKQAIALALFRGEAKNPQGKHNIRGDINVLLCGDPGTAKSQFLRYVRHVAPRAVLTTGQGASAVGLTAYVQRHPVTREWTLEAGAMVLADKGVCLIDEFDKMTDQDRTSIHEAMEQQSISVSKAGIVTSLQARCTVIAAANPTAGRYDSSRTFAANVELTEPILSRFDILCVVRDTADQVEDERLADFVIKSHMKMHPDSEKTQGIQEDDKPEYDAKTGLELIPQSLLRKYLIYARDNIHPKLEISDERIAKLYGNLRKESEETGSVAITIRNVESMIRMAEAHAKLHLRCFVTDDDVGAATRVMLQCFINTQKASVMRQMKKKFQSQLNYKRDNNELLFFLLKQLVHDQIVFERSRHGQGADVSTIAVDESEFLEKAHQLHIDSVKPFYKSHYFVSNNFHYNPQQKTIVKTIF